MEKTYMPFNMPLAMSYVPWQSWETLYDEKTALERGVIFPSLYLPFTAGRDAS